MRGFSVAVAILATSVGFTSASEPTRTTRTVKRSQRVEIASFQRLMSQLDARDRERQRRAIELLTSIVSPQPAVGVVKIRYVFSPWMTLPSGHYLEGLPPMHFPEKPDFPLPRKLAYQEETSGLINPKDKAK